MKGAGRGGGVAQNDEPEDEDRLLISASAIVAAEDISRLNPLPEATLTRREDGTLLLLPTVTVTHIDAGERQKGFEAALSQLVARLAACGLTEDYVRETDAHVRLYVSLCPECGQAGIVLYPELLRPWLSLGAQIDIDAL